MRRCLRPFQEQEVVVEAVADVGLPEVVVVALQFCENLVHNLLQFCKNLVHNLLQHNIQVCSLFTHHQTLSFNKFLLPPKAHQVRMGHRATQSTSIWEHAHARQNFFQAQWKPKQYIFNFVRNHDILSFIFFVNSALFSCQTLTAVAGSDIPFTHSRTGQKPCWIKHLRELQRKGSNVFDVCNLCSRSRARSRSRSRSRSRARSLSRSHTLALTSTLALTLTRTLALTLSHAHALAHAHAHFLTRSRSHAHAHAYAHAHFLTRSRSRSCARSCSRSRSR